MAYWDEIRNNDFFGAEFMDTEQDGDMLAYISIDAWHTDADVEEGAVIAHVILSTHGDILVDYRDRVARTDRMAQKAISEAKAALRAYYAEQTKAPSNNHKD